MNSNPVRAAVDLVDTEPSTKFLSALRAQLLADGTATEAITTTQQPSAPASETVEEYVMLAPNPNRRGRNRRMQKFALAAAACAAAVAAIVVIRLNNDSGAKGGLRDVDATEASPLAQAAKITTQAIGPSWSGVNDFKGSTYADVNAATNAALPECSVLKSVGLMDPTTKSVHLHQDFLNGPAPMLHDVWVFATPEDASRAMDVIAGDVYPACLFDLFDRLTPLSTGVKATSKSRGFDAPPITPHGDRQVIIGQTIDYTLSVGGTIDGVQAINAFVQVGRAIAFIDPQYFGDVSPSSNVEQAITVSTDALQKVFGH